MNILQEYEAEFGPSDQSEGGDKDEAEVIILLLTVNRIDVLPKDIFVNLTAGVAGGWQGDSKSENQPTLVSSSQPQSCRLTQQDKCQRKVIFWVKMGAFGK